MTENDLARSLFEDVRCLIHQTTIYYLQDEGTIVL